MTFAISVCQITLSNADLAIDPDKHAASKKDGPTVDLSTPSAQDEARKREQSAEEDPLAQRQADRVDRPEEWEVEPSGVNLYGSIRIRYRHRNKESFWGDGGSRIGVEGKWQFRRRQWIFSRAEAGFNVLDELEYLFDPSAASGEGSNSTFFKRLLYVGWESPETLITFGKNWSPYYRVAGFTDRFESTGGSASGTYNAGTDGGATGTGRADNALQTRALVGDSLTRWGIKPFKLNVQLQNDESVPHLNGADYGLALSLSGIIEFGNDYTVGIAYNHATVDINDPDVRESGIDGDAQALLLGTRWFGDRWYLGTTVSRLLNHETTNETVYFDGWGWEVYSQYQLKGRLWIVGGWNYLVPDKQERQAGDYLLKYGVIGLRYSFDDFGKIIFTNAQFDEGQKADGSSFGNTFTIGVRWDLP